MFVFSVSKNHKTWISNVLRIKWMKYIKKRSDSYIWMRNTNKNNRHHVSQIYLLLLPFAVQIKTLLLPYDHSLTSSRLYTRMIMSLLFIYKQSILLQKYAFRKPNRETFFFLPLFFIFSVKWKCMRREREKEEDVIMESVYIFPSLRNKSKEITSFIHCVGRGG